MTGAGPEPPGASGSARPGPARAVPDWRATPPALFPPCLGLLGTGLAWRGAAAALGLPGAIGGAILLAGGLLLALALVLYGAKLLARPAVLLEDLGPPPARGSIAAGTMSLLLLAAALLPVHEGIARAVWWTGLLAHAALALPVALLLWRGRAGGIPVTPVLFLPFVGQIAAPVAGLPLGHDTLSAAILIASVPPALLVGVLALLQALARPVPPPQRPASTIFLTPFALFGTGAAGLGLTMTATLLFLAGLFLLALLLLRFRWMAAGGWTPGWAAFTFPTASFAGLAFAAEDMLPGAGAGAVGLAVTVAVTLLLAVVLRRSLAAWATGRLAAMTGAARA